MRKSSDVIAIICSDLHLSHKPPIYRSQEPDWYTAMKRPLKEIIGLRNRYDCPVFCCGDVFDNWNSPPELINWAMENLPSHMFAIPGQHDLPEHSLAQLDRSAFRTLSQAKSIHELSRTVYTFNKFDLYAFPYGTEVAPVPQDSKSEQMNIAIVHEYHWIKGCSYSGASAEGNRAVFDGRFLGYDIVFSGDNHHPFCVTYKRSKGSPTFVNCGAIMRRASDDLFEPSVWLLDMNGEVHQHKLDTSRDIYLPTEKTVQEEATTDLTKLLSSLEKLGADFTDFTKVVKEYLDREGIDPIIARVVRKALEKGNG